MQGEGLNKVIFLGDASVKRFFWRSVIYLLLILCYLTSRKQYARTIIVILVIMALMKVHFNSLIMTAKRHFYIQC